jgi:hypothetical protein
VENVIATAIAEKISTPTTMMAIYVHALNVNVNLRLKIKAMKTKVVT